MRSVATSRTSLLSQQLHDLFKQPVPYDLLTDLSPVHQVYLVLVVDQLPTIWHFPLLFSSFCIAVFSSDVVYSLFAKITLNFGDLCGLQKFVFGVTEDIE